MTGPTKWVRCPAPGEFRGEGKWSKAAELGVSDAQWREYQESGFLPVYEGDEPPPDAD